MAPMPVAVSSRSTPGMLAIVYWTSFVWGSPHANFAQPAIVTSFVLTTCNDFCIHNDCATQFFSFDRSARLDRISQAPGKEYIARATGQAMCRTRTPRCLCA